MILDTQEEFSVAQAVTAVGDTASTNIYDTQSSGPDEGIGEPLWLVAQTNTAATSAGAATVSVVLQHSDDASAWSDVLVGPAVALAGLTANTPILRTRLPIGLSKRYFRVAYRVGVAVLTAGTFSAFLTTGVQANNAYKSGFTVL